MRPWHLGEGRPTALVQDVPIASAWWGGSHGTACPADFGGEQEQPVEQVRRPSNLLTLAADEQVEEQPPGGAESEARMGLGLASGIPIARQRSVTDGSHAAISSSRRAAACSLPCMAFAASSKNNGP